MDMDIDKRYQEKIQKFCRGMDPYNLDMLNCNDLLPKNFGYFDLINYCFHHRSPFTRNDFNNWKAMDAYKYYESGWVQSISCKKFDDIGSIIFAMVRGGQC